VIEPGNPQRPSHPGTAPGTSSIRKAPKESNDIEATPTPMAQRTPDSGSEHTALVLGASGIIGWRVTLEAIQYPAPQAFKRVIALTNRPLTKKDAYLPDNSRLDIHSGIDLTKDVEEATNSLATIPGIGDVTHVYFTGKQCAQPDRGMASVHRLNACQSNTQVHAHCMLANGTCLLLKPLLSHSSPPADPALFHLHSSHSHNSIH
jgi:hypothetical protein